MNFIYIFFFCFITIICLGKELDIIEENLNKLIYDKKYNNNKFEEIGFNEVCKAIVGVVGLVVETAVNIYLPGISYFGEELSKHFTEDNAKTIKELFDGKLVDLAVGKSDEMLTGVCGWISSARRNIGEGRSMILNEFKNDLYLYSLTREVMESGKDFVKYIDHRTQRRFSKIVIAKITKADPMKTIIESDFAIITADMIKYAAGKGLKGKDAELLELVKFYSTYYNYINSKIPSYRLKALSDLEQTYDCYTISTETFSASNVDKVGRYLSNWDVLSNLQKWYQAEYGGIFNKKIVGKAMVRCQAQKAKYVKQIYKVNKRFSSNWFLRDEDIRGLRITDVYHRESFKFHYDLVKNQETSPVSDASYKKEISDKLENIEKSIAILNKAMADNLLVDDDQEKRIKALEGIVDELVKTLKKESPINKPDLMSCLRSYITPFVQVVDNVNGLLDGVGEMFQVAPVEEYIDISESSVCVYLVSASEEE